MNIKQYSALTDRSEPSIRKAIAKGNIKAIKVNGMWDIEVNAPAKQAIPKLKSTAPISKGSLKEAKLAVDIKHKQKQTLEIDQRLTQKRLADFELWTEVHIEVFSDCFAELAKAIRGMKLSASQVKELNGVINKCFEKYSKNAYQNISKTLLEISKVTNS